MMKDKGEIEAIDWDGKDDPRNPINWPSSKKWMVMIVACIAMFVVELNATSITSAASEINAQFSVSDAAFPNSYWPVTSWTFAGAIFPVLLTPVIEDHGTRSGFLLTYLLFAIFVIPQAVAPNFATLIITRAICGACGGTIAAVVDGIAADLWLDEGERGRAVTVYTFALVGGYTVGPVIGGAVISALGWRWIFYIQIIIYFGLLPLLFLTLRETRGQVLLTQRARRMRKADPTRRVYSEQEFASSSTMQDLKEGLIRPSQLLCTEPVLASFTLWSAFTLGMIFTFTQSIPQVYSGLYHWSDSATGIVQISVFVGQALGFVACWISNDVYMHYKRAAIESDSEKGNEKSEAGKVRLEARLYLSIPATIFGLAGGFFWYAWTSSPDLHWMLPTIGLALVGFGMMCIVTAVDIYITDSYTIYAGSAIAAVTFGENTISAFLPLATNKMYDTLGDHWASSLLAFICLLLALAPIILVWKGESIRRKSRFMRAGDDNDTQGKVGDAADSAQAAEPGSPIRKTKDAQSPSLRTAGSGEAASERTLVAEV